MRNSKQLSPAFLNGSVNGRGKNYNADKPSLRDVDMSNLKNDRALTEIIQKVKQNRTKVVNFKKPVLSKEVTLPPQETATINISKLISLSNINVPLANLIKFDPKAFTSWTTFERFLHDTYDVGLFYELFYFKGKFEIIKSKGVKIGYLIVTKPDALEYTGAQRLTRVMQDQVNEEIYKELAQINRKIAPKKVIKNNGRLPINTK